MRSSSLFGNASRWLIGQMSAVSRTYGHF